MNILLRLFVKLLSLIFFTHNTNNIDKINMYSDQKCYSTNSRFSNSILLLSLFRQGKLVSYTWISCCDNVYV